MTITKREIIVSIALVAIMIMFGFLISGNIQDRQNDKNAVYYKAIQIDDTDLFRHAMNTSAGNAFVYGDLNAVDTVTFQEIGGKYMYIEKIEEHYNMHIRTVTKTRTVNGQTETYTDIETYYSWDYHDSWDKHCNKISFCGIEFDYDAIPCGSKCYIDTIHESHKVRYIYYGVEAHHTGTIYANLSDKTITHVKFFEDRDIEKTFDCCIHSGGVVVFWIFWVLLIGAMVYGFYYIDNKWLE